MERTTGNFRCFAILVFSLAIGCMAVFTLPLAAQTTYGSIVGTVTDASGASIPGAAVTLTNTGTSERKTAESGADGNYQFVNLVPGLYRVDIEKEGFKHNTREQIVVEVQAAVRINASLQLGDVKQVIEVTAQTPLLQTESGSVDQVVSGRTVLEMPLNGRNVINLIELVPGVVPQGSSSGNPLSNQLSGTTTNNNGWGNYQISGGLASQSVFFYDGVPLNIISVNSLSLVPTQDAIQEFRVDTNDVSPEFGRFAGGVVNLVSKSSTNEFHGSAYEYDRNTVLNANDFYSNLHGVKRPPFNQNQYGANVGGPVIKNKMFFWFGWEGFSQRLGIPLLTTVPTAAMDGGDFSALGVPIYDPLTTCGLPGTPACSPGQPTRQQFSYNGQLNVIPPDRLDPTAKVMQSFWGSSNLPGTANNFFTSALSGGSHNQYNSRGDWNVSDKQRIFVHHTEWVGNSLSYNPFRNETGNVFAHFAANDAVIGDTYTFNPTTIADFRVSFLRSWWSFTSPSQGIDLSKFGPAYGALASQISVDNIPIPSVSGYYNFWECCTVNSQPTNNYFVSGNLTKIIGRHNVKFGGELRDYIYSLVQTSNGSGSFSFDNLFTSQNPLAPGNTGSPFASFMAGYPSSGGLTLGVYTKQNVYYRAWYIMDRFRVNRKLTLDYGGRWDFPGSMVEARDRMTMVQPNAVDPLAQATGLPLHGQVALVNTPQQQDRHEQSIHWHLVAPRVGFAYSLTDKTVLRGGYGISYVPPETINFLMSPFISPVNAAATTMVTSINGGATPYDTLSNPFPTGLLQPAQHNVAALSTLEGQGIGGPIYKQRYPYMQQWNFTVEHQLGEGMMFQIGYVASKGTHIPFSSLSLDQLPDSDLSLGSALLASVPNPFHNVLPASAGQLALPTVTQGQLLRPYPQYLGVSNFSPNSGMTNYQSMQAMFKKRFRRGGTLQVAYTASKLISDTDSLAGWLESHGIGGLQDQNNLRLERSLTSFDVPQRLVVSYVVDLPVGKGKKLLGNVNGIADKVVSGWGINGISTFQRGFPLGFSTAENLTNSYGGGSRPNVVSGVNKSIPGSATSRLNEWFNVAAFSQPPAFTFGGESRTDPVLRGQGVNNWDFALFKNTGLTERLELQFRAEFFNLFNRVQFGDPGTTLGTPQFGEVTSQMNQPRLIQFGLRLTF
jgi:hypothetical protein